MEYEFTSYTSKTEQTMEYEYTSYTSKTEQNMEYEYTSYTSKTEQNMEYEYTSYTSKTEQTPASRIVKLTTINRPENKLWENDCLLMKISCCWTPWSKYISLIFHFWK